MPTVSVILPNYNHARYLPDRLHSILYQTYTDFELICLDDASTDNSIEILESYKLNHNFILLKNGKNSGNPFLQWNKGINFASGDYIWIAESDDQADLNMLQSLVVVLNNNPTVGMVYCQSLFINDIGEVIGSHFDELNKLDPYLWANDFIYHGDQLLSNYMAIMNIVPNSSAVLFRKEVYMKAGMAPENMYLCGDWLTWAKIFSLSDIGFVAKPLNYFRTHDVSVRSKIHRQLRYIHEYMSVVKKIYDMVEVKNRIKRKTAYQVQKRVAYIVTENPKEFNWGNILSIFMHSKKIFPLEQSCLILFISIISFININCLINKKLKSGIRFINKLTKKIIC